jgi:anti-anti-sigma factor
MAATSTPWTVLHLSGRHVSVTYPAAGATVIAVGGGPRSGDFAALDRLVTQALDHGHRHLVLDLHAVSSIEPEALELLWAALMGVRRRGGTLATAGARPAVRKAFEALGLGGLPLYGSVRAALSATHEESRS